MYLCHSVPSEDLKFVRHFDFGVLIVNYTRGNVMVAYPKLEVPQLQMRVSKESHCDRF